MLEITNLKKSYGKEAVLKNVNLHLEEGKVYGLLGRNGVGKSTLLNIISNQIIKDDGSVKLFGEDVFENSKAIEEMCLVKEKGMGVEDVRVKKIFSVAKTLYKNWDDDYKNSLMNIFNINVKKKYSKLSRGNQTIIGLIIGLASRAKLTMFDEPTLGLDAAFRDRFYQLLLEDIEENPRTVVISTHLIDEVTNLFEEVIILKNGVIYIKNEIENLLNKAYFLNGRLDNMKDILKNKTILSKDDFASNTIVGIFDNLSDEEKVVLVERNIDISSISLQKLFVLLTENTDVKGVL